MNKEVEQVIDNIKKIRNEKQISIIQLSNESGISRSHLFYIESKKSVPSLNTLSKLAQALNVKMKDFFD
ncbi:MAG: helix-turn-helix transcriptional regulator [Spirochaetaceae bacterium]|nr:helix-turn-helix transcriptional regulator [Spirochaetaceae bacterium]MBR4824765.1 helix-turn-helix transcriptional regulator [Spirochaetaceae bacterium]